MSARDKVGRFLKNRYGRFPKIWVPLNFGVAVI